MIRFSIAILSTWAIVHGAHTPEKIASRTVRARKLSLTAGTETNSYALDETGCTAPSTEGGWGYCGPASCKDNYSTCSSAGGGIKIVDGVTGSWNSYYSDSNCATYLTNSATDITDWSPKGACDSSCTQVTTGVCSSEFLNNILSGFGVKYAWCNDKWLHIIASGETGGMYTQNMNDTPYPPAAGSDFSLRTGMDTLDTSRLQELYFPLTPTALSTSLGTNNNAVYDEQSGAGAKSYLISSDGDKYGLPSDGGIGMAVNGMPIFPVYNNNAKYTPQKCEVDSCNEHVGRGGGAAHYHGDPFADDWNCLYGSKNYTAVDAHPPVIGFSYDGYLIYGRYLSENAPGFNNPGLDACGGHVHADAGTDDNGLDLQTYHYHTQIFDATVPASAIATEGEAYVATVPGPFQCWKADLTASTGSSALLEATASSSYVGKNDMEKRCCGMTDYYLVTGNTFPDSNSYASSSTCTAPTSITNGAYNSECTGTLLSGHSCTPICKSGFAASGLTICIGGTLSEATCAANASPTQAPSDAPTTGSATTSAPTSAPTSTPVVDSNGGDGAGSSHGVTLTVSLISSLVAVLLY